MSYSSPISRSQQTDRSDHKQTTPVKENSLTERVKNLVLSILKFLFSCFRFSKNNIKATRTTAKNTPSRIPTPPVKSETQNTASSSSNTNAQPKRSVNPPPAPQVQQTVPSTATTPSPQGAGTSVNRKRVGFPNFTNRNCSHNSKSIVIAYCDLPLSENQILTPQQLEAEKKIISEYEPLIKAKQKEYETAETNKSEALKKRDAIPWRSYENNEQHEKYHAEMQQHSKRSDELFKEIKQLEKRLSDAKHKVEEHRMVARAKEVVAIVRGEKTGNLTMQDASDLSCSLDLNYKFKEEIPTDKGAEELEKELHHQLFHTDWLVIRVGGRGHWWTMVRNPGTNTVDLIDDDRITFNYYTFDQIYDRWKNPNAWKGQFGGAQLHFFSRYVPKPKLDLDLEIEPPISLQDLEYE